MDIIIIPRDARLNRHENALVITSDAGRKSVPLSGVKHVLCMGNGSVTIPLLKEMGRRGIRFTVMEGSGKFLGAFEPVDESPSGRVRIGQASLCLDSSKRHEIASKIVTAQIRSMVGLLKRYLRNGAVGLEESINELQRMGEKVSKCNSVATLLGAEGQARATFHRAFHLISPAARLDKRRRRPPPDEVNCLMSFFNVLLYSACSTELAKTHLDQSVSFLHSPGTGRRSLAIDMAETFRPVMSDALLLSMFRRKQVDTSMFDRSPGICLLNERGRIKATKRFWSRIEEQSGKLTLRQSIHRQCLSLERKALGLGEFRAFTWRG